jgi:hypothetical protein
LTPVLSILPASQRRLRSGPGVAVASLLDIAATKLAVIQKRAELKDYLDIDALLGSGIDLAEALAAGQVVYGDSFNPLISLKALSYFDDVPALPSGARSRLTAAVAAIDRAAADPDALRAAPDKGG